MYRSELISTGRSNSTAAGPTPRMPRTSPPSQRQAPVTSNLIVRSVNLGLGKDFELLLTPDFTPTTNPPSKDAVSGRAIDGTEGEATGRAFDEHSGGFISGAMSGSSGENIGRTTGRAIGENHGETVGAVPSETVGDVIGNSHKQSLPDI